MNTVDVNYRNQKNILIATVSTHSIGKNRQNPLQLAEVITAIALVVLLSFLDSSLAYIAAGMGMIFYPTKSPQNEKQIYLMARTHFKNSHQRELKIYIHPSVVKQKLEKGTRCAIESERNALPRDFGMDLDLHELEKKRKTTTVQLDSAVVVQSYGAKTYMEDLVFGCVFNVEFGDKTLPVDLKAVFDGHNGVPSITQDELKEIVRGQLERHGKVACTDVAIFNALKFIGLELNEQIKSGGSTMVLAMQIEKSIWFANIGDSRALIIEPDGTILNMTVDAHPSGSHTHGPLDMSYVGPALVRGATLDFHHIYSASGRKNAMLRSLGDYAFPKIARPKITKYDLTQEKVLLVLGSDGLFDKGRGYEVGSFMFTQIEQNLSLKELALRTAIKALSKGVKDNLTCLVKWVNSDINITNENE